MRLQAFAVLFLGAATFGAETIPTTSGVVAHEWGTFTSVADIAGNPVSWYALGGPSKLPCYVHRSDIISKRDAFTTVRMETPVLYFYAPRKAVLSVDVTFRGGRMTEWYPAASGRPVSRLEWKSVEVLPGEDLTVPSGGEGSHYYAARATDAAPLRVGKEQEKLLFYRGAGDIDVPVRPKFLGDGKVLIRNASAHAVPAVIVFENRGGKVGYRTVRDMRDSVEVDAPELTGDVQALRGQLAEELMRGGLYPKEAQAMLETWRDSWFEEGVRTIYIVPRATVDSALPIEIRPAAAELARVFVGRVEMLSPARIKGLQAAAAARDRAVLGKYGRFLEAFWVQHVPTPFPAEMRVTQGGCAQ
jgi:hypothetical protein